jgi:hypothetical protein
MRRGDLIDVARSDMPLFFMFETAMTRAVKDALHVSDEALYEERLDKLLWAVRDELNEATERGDGDDWSDLEVEVFLGPEIELENPLTPEEYDDLKLKAIIVIYPDYDQQPVFTIMLPWE